MTEDMEALEQEALEQLAAEREAFEARFPPEAFRTMAEVLKVRPTPENLSRLRARLLPDFYRHLDTRHRYKEGTRKERINRLKKLCEAATTLHSLLTSFDTWWDLPLDLIGPDDFDAAGATDQFETTLKRLADTAAGRIEQLASTEPRRGRPSKNEPFRQLTPRLIRIYERIRKEPAGLPHYLPDSGGIYGGKGDFYLFALAVWRCLQDNLPSEALGGIPSTAGALAQELLKNWPKGSANR